MASRKLSSVVGFHEYAAHGSALTGWTHLRRRNRVDYTFGNHFHPYVGELIDLLNRRSVDGLLDVTAHAKLVETFFEQLYAPAADAGVGVASQPKNIDVSEDGPYAGYNWELLFHVPFTIAVHLSKNQRFAEAQRWFHYVFDPTCDDTGFPAPQRFWKFLRFRQATEVHRVEELLALLAKPTDECTPEDLRLKELVLAGYEALRDHPFQPHVVARTRVLSYQYAVVMKYLDNLVAWGDSLFRQDTIETINEATQLYVLAANLLGPRPQQVPARGTIRPRTYAQLREAGLDAFGNALVTLEGQFPFDLALPSTAPAGQDLGAALFGLGRTLYFCMPRNDQLLGYWDLVADRLFKIRHCQNIEGVVRQLPLFEPPLDPGMLVKAAAAGIDVSSLVAGRNQPLSPVRASLLIQKALEICGEVRSMGSAMLSALEKQDTERLTLLRQGHEITIQRLVQDVKFLQWKEAEEATAGLLRGREAIFDRYRHFQLLLGRAEADFAALATVTLDRTRLTEQGFDEVYAQLVAAYAGEVTLETDQPPALAGGDDPQVQSGAQSATNLLLSRQENVELNVHMPAARAHLDAAIDIDEIFGVLGMLPNLGIDLHFWGLGGHLEFGGPALAAVGRVLSGKERGIADQRGYQGTRAGRTAGYQRRGNDYAQASNAAAHELMTNGRQLIAALIREQVTRHEYENTRKQIEHAQAVDAFLREKFTNAELYAWLQGELAKQFYDCYRFAFDIARRAEQTMKHELMRPELDALDFVKFNYWDGGRRGLLAGETLYLDIKRMELAYLDHNRREYELTRHVSLAQLDPLALLRLKATGSCQVTLPEWLFDLDTAGHYLRRIKTVALSIPAVTGPYTSVHCTLSLLRSSVRRSPLLADGEYARSGGEDDRFVDYSGTIQSIVTSAASNDAGMFETNLRDERYLPFEGTGALSTWKIDLPPTMRPFDYLTISDLVLHLRYTAREGGAQLRDTALASVADLVSDASASGLVRLFNLRYDFPGEWYAFLSGNGDFTATLRREHFPYLAQRGDITVDKLELYGVQGNKLLPATLPAVDPAGLTDGLHAGAATLTLPAGGILARDENANVFVLLHYSLVLPT